jgi:histidyl-tRNA synthetase
MSEELGYAVRCATALREAGVRTQLHAEKKKFKAKLAYADKLGIPFAAFIGGDEEAAGTVALKNLATGEQVSCPVDEAAEIVRAEVARRNAAKLIRGE